LAETRKQRELSSLKILKQNKTAMASRFGVADSDVIQDLKASSENRNTRKSTNLRQR
jgi:hypothetical protein